ncbi:hypothetical protein N7466_008369 [Penicillium verhagenii]|uniref:uncharacterized protein n=1 Tax=Penicillium verhagenii TaxID=1562060 RepID=UPI002544E045|nr:uncharacterized protein N7466_008369 [Penicillium verhagenii]KAJ5924182.1 hypothetical protein N7466_008369 [Penicillium verhagenii]
MDPKKTPEKAPPKEASSPQSTGASTSATAGSSQTSTGAVYTSTLFSYPPSATQRHDLQGIGSWIVNRDGVPTYRYAEEGTEMVRGHHAGNGK